MKYKKVLFIGLGGAGQRHLRILKQLLPSASFSAFRKTAKTPLLNSDFTVDKKRNINEVYGLKIFHDINEAFENKPSLTVISTPTSCHREPLMLAMEVGSAIIVEKPWAENLIDFNYFSKEILRKKLPFLISFQRRYHPLMKKAKLLIDLEKIGKPMVASFTVFSDVTTWHAYEDWRSLYAVRSNLGGGVLLTEIHEIDLAYWFFGLPEAVHCTGGNRGSEKIDVEDTIQMSLLYHNFSVQITLCFMHKNRMRHFHIVGTDGTLSWNEEYNKLGYFHNSELSEEFIASDFTNDSMFITQAEYFINNWGTRDSFISLQSAGHSLAIVESALSSMKSKKVENINVQKVQNIL